MFKNVSRKRMKFAYTPSKLTEELITVSSQMGVNNSNKMYLNRKTFNDYQVMYVAKGEIHLNQYGNKYVYKQGETVLMSLYDEHEYYANPEKATQVLWFHFRGATTESIVKTLNINKLFPIKYVNPKIEGKILDLFTVINRENKDFEYELAPMLYEMVAQISRETLVELENTINSSQKWFHSAVILYIENHITEKLTIEDISRGIGLKKSYFVKKFSNFFDIPPYQLIIKMKLEYSTDLLISDDISVCEIANKLCFTDQSHYGKHFKKNYGTSPANYRKMFTK